MNILYFSLITASIATCTLMLGFVVGMGYQKAEDDRHLRKVEEENDRFYKRCKEESLKAIEEAYKLGKEHGETDLIFTFDDQDNEVHFGGF